jgi:YcxB-like protein
MEQHVSEPVTLTFTHRENEYVSATRLFYAHVYHTRFQIVISGLVLTLGFCLILLNLDLFFGGLTAVTGLILLIFNLYPYLVTPRQFFRRNAKFRKEFHLQFSEDGLISRSEDSESKLAWSFYSRVWETPRFYFLRYDNDYFTLIPKRVFISEVQESAFRDLLRRNIGEYSESPQCLDRESKGFQGEYKPPQTPPDWR